MSSIFQVSISGNLGKDAEVRVQEGGDSILMWSVAVGLWNGKEGKEGNRQELGSIPSHHQYEEKRVDFQRSN